MAFKAILLRQKLKAEGKTREDLATAVKKHVRTVSRWLAGTNPPKPNDLEAIARFLNCEPQDFDPFFADMGAGEVSIQAHVTTASHNAYELMRLRYGVSQKQIMELAPVLFAIAAGHALRVPGQDQELEIQARKYGRPSTEMIGDAIDLYASRARQCFGVSSPNPLNEPSRNLFESAIHRLSSNAKDYVDATQFVGAAPGDVPNASGFNPDIDSLNEITGGDPHLIAAIIKGRVRLATVLAKNNPEQGTIQIGSFPNAIRHEHNKWIMDQWETDTKKLETWQKFYEKLHPDLAEEYDRLVSRHCHEEGWCPEGYTDEERIQCWINPFMEIRFINKNTLNDIPTPKVINLKTDNRLEKLNILQLANRSPTVLRFTELQVHRAQSKKLFEDNWP